jgi:hypothetical protein
VSLKDGPSGRRLKSTTPVPITSASELTRAQEVGLCEVTQRPATELVSNDSAPPI